MTTLKVINAKIQILYPLIYDKSVPGYLFGVSINVIQVIGLNRLSEWCKLVIIFCAFWKHIWPKLAIVWRILEPPLNKPKPKLSIVGLCHTKSEQWEHTHIFFFFFFPAGGRFCVPHIGLICVVSNQQFCFSIFSRLFQQNILRTSFTHVTFSAILALVLKPDFYMFTLSKSLFFWGKIILETGTR